MLIFVHLDDCVEAVLESRTVCCKTDNGEYNVSTLSGFIVATDPEYFGRVAGIDAVA